MPELRLGSARLSVEPGANLLQALLNAGHAVPHSCRAGACQACLVRAAPGQADPASNDLLAPELREAGWLLSCQCRVTQDMDIELPDLANSTLPARLLSSEPMGSDVLRLRIEPDKPLRFQAGQHLLIWLDEQLARPYSIASLPGESVLEFHLRLHPHGQFSQAIVTLRAGDRVRLGGATGVLGYDPAWHDRPLLLLSQGTGLAPLQAVARQARRDGHGAPIDIWHWSATGQCYLAAELERWADPSVSLRQRALASLDQDLRELRLASRATMALVCGSPEFTERLRRPLFMAGLSGRQVIGEAFISGTQPFEREELP